MVIHFLVLIFAAFVSFGTERVIADGGNFCYDETKPCGPTKWPDSCGKNTGMQSPVDLIVPKSTASKDPKAIVTNKKYSDTLSSFFLQVTGTTVKVQADSSGTGSGMELSGDGLDGSYKFAQLHFHWGTSVSKGSEHTIKGKQFPMELHFVHYSSKFKDLGDALGNGGSDAIAVIGLFFDVCKSCKNNAEIDSILAGVKKYLSGKDSHGMVQMDGKLNLKQLMRGELKGKGRFFRYSGSLTTPPCSEKVLFTIIEEPLEVTKQQMQSFNDLSYDGKKVGDNFRPLQKLGGRKIEYQNFVFK